MAERTRVRSTAETRTRHEGHFSTATGVFTAPPGYVRTYSLQHPDVMKDTVTTGFRRKSRRGDVINSPMTKTQSSCELRTSILDVWQPPGTTGWRDTAWGSGLCWDNTQVIIDEGMLQVPQLITEAITEAYARVNPPDVDALVTLAEMRETLSFLSQPFQKAVLLTGRYKSFLLRYRQARSDYERRLALFNQRMASRRPPRYPRPVWRPPQFKVGRIVASDISSAWLAFRYGLMPLVYDIQGYLEAFNKPPVQPIRMTARGFAKKTWRGGVGEATWNANYGCVTKGSWFTDYEVTVRGGVLYVPKIALDENARLREKYGIVFHRVPIAAWEGITLSFVADWFFNVGEYLEAITAHARAEVLSAWTTVTMKAYAYSTTWVHFAHAYTQTPPVPPRFTRDVKHIVRAPASLKDVGLVRRVNMNAKRYADAAALIHTMLLSTTRPSRGTR